jgi:hyperosmotically inducible protein
MRNLRWVQIFAISLAGAAAALPAPQAAGESEQTTTAPDNTKVNKSDRSKAEPTADQAKNNAGDRETMRNIRRAIVNDKSLSTYAHNVKIIADNGKVTLKGPVRSEEEKRAVESKAVEVAGSGNVTNKLTVKAGKSGATTKTNAKSS